MSGAISFSGSGDPGLGQVISGASQIKTNLDTLTEQASNGLISSVFSGLGSGASIALSLSPEIAALQISQSNIAAASGPMQVTQTAMTQIQSIASNFLAEMPNLNGLDPSEIDSAAASARSDITQLASLLDTQYGNTYVFAGQDSSNPPIPDPDQILSSGFFTQIQAAVGALSANGASATAAQTLAVAGSNAPGTSPFSAYLSQSPTALALPSVSLGSGQILSIGLLASTNSNAVSTGTSTTGSYMRDLMRALATVGSLSSSQVNDPGFASLVADTQSSVTGAIAAMSTDVGVLGTQQADLTSIQTNLSDTQTALSGQLSAAQDVNMASTLSNISLVQAQLQTSYQLISASAGMSLAKYLTSGA